MVLDATGKVIRQLDWSVQKGENQIDVEMTQLPKGVYWIRLNDGIETLVEKMVKD